MLFFLYIVGEARYFFKAIGMDGKSPFKRKLFFPFERTFNKNFNGHLLIDW